MNREGGHAGHSIQFISKFQVESGNWTNPEWTYCFTKHFNVCLNLCAVFYPFSSLCSQRMKMAVETRGKLEDMTYSITDLLDERITFQFQWDFQCYMHHRHMNAVTVHRRRKRCILCWKCFSFPFETNSFSLAVSVNIFVILQVHRKTLTEIN